MKNIFSFLRSGEEKIFVRGLNKDWKLDSVSIFRSNRVVG